MTKFCCSPVLGESASMYLQTVVKNTAKDDDDDQVFFGNLLKQVRFVKVNYVRFLYVQLFIAFKTFSQKFYDISLKSTFNIKIK